MRITTIPFNFSLAAAGVGYIITQPLPLPYRITHLYALGEPSPSQQLFIQLYKWGSSTLPTAGVPSGPTIFDDLIRNSVIRIGRIPTDMKLDIEIRDIPQLLCYASNTGTSTQQCMVELEVGLPDGS